jgi:methyltransferase-like protein/ubiquinone/menaquinone biosynthesis C-methylase UbiE
VIEYPGQVFPQSHPNRMATIAALHGISAAPPDRCRVLEVGCGAGDNLIALALGAPSSTFVGFDLARGGIEQGQSAIRELGLGNVQLQHADLMEFVVDGQYDYIVAHGFLSWVPQPIQHRLLNLCRESLAPNGVAYISYNAFPGCHIRNMLRDMMRIHTAGISEPRRKIQQARGLAQFLRDGQTKPDEYAALLRKEAEWILNRESDALLFHDDLADVNIPFWFREFAALVSRHGMQFFAEADYFEMNSQSFPPTVVEALNQIGRNVIAKEQYLDFLKCRRFRQSLIVHDDLPINRDPSTEVVRRMFVASAAAPNSAHVNLAPGFVETFTGRGGAVMQIDHALTKAAMIELQAAWPRPMLFAELVSGGVKRLGQNADPDDTAILAEVLFAAYSTGLVDLNTFRPPWATEISARPVASPLVRLQLRHGRDVVSTLRPTNLLIEDSLQRALLQLLDGNRDRAQIEIELRRQFETGEIGNSGELSSGKMPSTIDEALRKAAKDALLTA